ncbi:hypothetical protein EVA_05443 [gut metagenome]|uniref:Uncharacterized protein n=1 Tax=gut metagenome TaxID=749906 RepID=J9GGD6_9ZZZZ
MTFHPLNGFAVFSFSFFRFGFWHISVSYQRTEGCHGIQLTGQLFPGSVRFTIWFLKVVRFFHELLTILHQVHGKCGLFMGIDIFLTEYGFSLAVAFNLNGFRIVHNAFRNHSILRLDRHCSLTYLSSMKR